MQMEHEYVPGGVPPKPVKGYKWVRIGTIFEKGGEVRLPNGTKQRFGKFRLVKVEPVRERTGRLSANGRPRMGKTHVRSVEAKRRRNARKNGKGRYRFTGVHILHNVLDVGFVPLNRYKYHQKRWEKAGKVFTLKQAWGFRLRNSRRFDLPDVVVGALEKMYSVTPVYKEVNLPPPVRTPRNRTRSDSINRIYRMLQSVGCIEQRPGLAWRLAGEVSLRRHRNPDYVPPDDVVYTLSQCFATKKVDRPTKQAISYIVDPEWGTFEKVIGGRTTHVR